MSRWCQGQSRFNRRRSCSSGMVFYRVLELALAYTPVRYRDLVADLKPKRTRPSPPGSRGRPPSLDRPRAAQPWRASDLHSRHRPRPVGPRSATPRNPESIPSWSAIRLIAPETSPNRARRPTPSASRAPGARRCTFSVMIWGALPFIVRNQPFTAPVVPKVGFPR